MAVDLWEFPFDFFVTESWRALRHTLARPSEWERQKSDSSNQATFFHSSPHVRRSLHHASLVLTFFSSRVAFHRPCGCGTPPWPYILGQLPVESGVDLVGNLTQSPSTPRQHSPPHHPLVAVAQTWRPYRTLLWQCRASLLVTIDGCVDSGRREAESSCDGHRFGAKQVCANNLPALFTREFLTGSFSHGKKVGGWSFDILRVQGRRLWRKRKKDASRVQGLVVSCASRKKFQWNTRGLLYCIVAVEKMAQLVVEAPMGAEKHGKQASRIGRRQRRARHVDPEVSAIKSDDAFRMQQRKSERPETSIANQETAEDDGECNRAPRQPMSMASRMFPAYRKGNGVRRSRNAVGPCLIGGFMFEMYEER